MGAGKVLLSLGAATVAVVALTIYFLIAPPGVKKLWLSLIPRSRRERVGLLTDEVFDRVGGFMLGNLLTSLISGVGTYVWLLIFGVPYALLLALFVALRSHTHGGIDHRGDRGVTRGPHQGGSHRHRHGRVLRVLPVPRGLSG